MNCGKKQLSLPGVVATLALVFAAVADAGEKLTLFVDVDEASFVGPAMGVAGAFNVEGDTGSGAETFQCWGWQLVSGATNVSQVYFISGRGTIMTQGQEGVPMAVVGGTGDFRRAQGEALQVFTGDGFNFNIEFNLKGVRNTADDSDSD